MSEWSDYWSSREYIEQIAVSQKIKERMSLQEWEGFFSRLHYHSYLTQKIKNWYNLWKWIFIAAAFFSLILGYWLLLGVSIFFLFLAFYYGRKVHIFTITQNINTFVMPFLYYLKNDVWEDTILELEIDINPQFNAGKYDSQTQTYEIEWIRGKTRLIDGSEVHFKVIDNRREWTVKKYSRSGKLKYKTKSKIKTCYRVVLSWDPRRYPKEIGEVPPKFKLKGKQVTKNNPYTVFDPAAYNRTYRDAYKVLSHKIA